MEIREALDKAHETLTPAPEPVEAPTTTTEAPAAGVTDTTPALESGASPSATSERPRDEQGRFTTGTTSKTEVPKTAGKSVATPEGVSNGAASGKAVAAGEAKGDGAVTPAAPPPKADEPQASALRPPQAWKPAAREKWNAIPEEARAEIVRLENDTKRSLREAAEDRKAWQAFREMVQPYEPMIRASGAQHPLQAVQGLLQTAAVLRQGTPAEKARMGAQIIRDFGIDIQALASALDGQPESTPGQVDPASIAQRVEAQIMQRLQAQAQASRSQRNAAILDKFAAEHEFFDDVRDTMADIVSGRGIVEPTEKQLQEVYDLACRIHPEVSGIFRQREEAKRAGTAAAATQRTQAAASSVKSTPAVMPSRPLQPGKSTREAIAAAREKLGM